MPPNDYRLLARRFMQCRESSGCENEAKARNQCHFEEDGKSRSPWTTYLAMVHAQILLSWQRFSVNRRVHPFGTNHTSYPIILHLIYPQAAGHQDISWASAILSSNRRFVTSRRLMSASFYDRYRSDESRAGALNPGLGFVCPGTGYKLGPACKEPQEICEVRPKPMVPPS
jgi:hypothetical protein